MSQTSKRPLFAVLIDADNIPAKFAADVLKEVAAFGEPRCAAFTGIGRHLH